uniref:NADH-ubiquinone oxidoreductase chain 2 n=1 Tax=Omalonyx unguis TaxID=1851496 RepID=A0A8F7C8T8_9EUPU|nr:NADH dehydrogenase subunit 2 [Omalonyx unguis]
MKIFFYMNYLMMFFLPVLSLSSSDWILSWFYMEIMLMFFYSFFFKINQDILTNFSSMKYFIIQGMASLFLLVSGLMIFYHNMSTLMILIFFISLLIKLGVFPFHFWVVPILKNLNIIMLFLLLFIMKIIPLSFMNIIFFEISNNSIMTVFFLFFSFCTMFIGSFMGNNFSSMNLMLGSSSINHSGWFLLSISMGLLWMYFFIYGLTLLFFLFSIYSMENLGIFLSLIGLSGLPPFAVFFAKLKVIMFFILNKYFLLIVLLIILSVISLKFYLKFSFFYYLKLKKYFFSFSYISLLFFLFNSIVMFIYLFFYSLIKKHQI